MSTEITNKNLSEESGCLFEEAMSKAREMIREGASNEAVEYLVARRDSPELAKLPADRRSDLCYLIGDCEEKMGRTDNSKVHYRCALEAQPGHLDALKALTRLSLEAGQVEEANRHLKSLLACHKDDLSKDELYGIYISLARLRQQAEDLEGMRSAVESSLRCNPSSSEARYLLISYHRAKGNWDKVAQHLRRILDFCQDPDERFAILLEIGDIYRDRLENVDEADRCYREATDLAPHDPSPRERLVNLHRGAGRVREELREIAALASTGTDKESRANRYHQMGLIYRDNLDDRLTAIACFNQALDLNPDLFEAFEEGAVTLRECKEWKALEEHHRLMLGRMAHIAKQPVQNLPAQSEHLTARRSEVRGALWRNLGELYRVHLDDDKNAGIALEMACNYRPKDMDAKIMLGQVWGRNPDVPASKREKLHREILRHHPENVDSLAGLRSAYLSVERLDAAWCVGALMIACPDLPAEEVERHRGLKRSMPLPFARNIDSQAWMNWVRHPAEDPDITRLIAAVGSQILPHLGRDLREHGVTPRDRLDPHMPLAILRLLNPVGKLLALGDRMPSVYRSQENTGDIRVMATQEPAFVVGPDVLGGGSGPGLTFRLGRALTYLRPEYRLAHLLTPGQLARLLEGGGFDLLKLKVVDEEAHLETPRGPQGHEAVPPRLLKKFHAALTSPEGKALVTMAEIIRRKTDTIDINRWAGAVALTADRAGLVACEDPEAARSLLTDTSNWPQLREFAVSEDYFSIRHYLGIAHSPENIEADFGDAEDFAFEDLPSPSGGGD